jgi:hypothetical protein
MRLDLTSLSNMEKLRKVMTNCNCNPEHVYYIKKAKLWCIDLGGCSTLLTKRGVLAIAKKYSKGGDKEALFADIRKEHFKDFFYE